MSGPDDWIPMGDDSGFIALVGPLYHRPFDGGPVSWFRFWPEDKHRNRNDVVHGGMLLTFADRALGWAGRRGDMSRRQATVQLDLHFIQPVRIGGPVDMEARLIRETRSLVFVEGTMTSGGEVAVTAKGVWKIFGARD